MDARTVLNVLRNHLDIRGNVVRRWHLHCENVKMNTDRIQEKFLLVRRSQKYNLLVCQNVYLFKGDQLQANNQNFTCSPDNCQCAFYLSIWIISDWVLRCVIAHAHHDTPNICWGVRNDALTSICTTPSRIDFKFLIHFLMDLHYVLVSPAFRWHQNAPFSFYYLKSSCERTPQQNGTSLPDYPPRPW